jgi:hypothetical protein
MQLLHSFLVPSTVPDDTLQYFAAFADGTLRYFCTASSSQHLIIFAIIRGLLQKSWQHIFSEISKAPTGISKFAAERQQHLISNDAAR